jgi:hypothetical protein
MIGLRRVIVAAAALLLLVPAAVLADNQVPLRGADLGHFDVPGACGDGGVQVIIGGAGHATQLGRYAYTAAECFDPVAGTFSGSASMTAADGSRLTGAYSGNVAPTDDPDVIVYDEILTVSGGTERFTGASGQVRIVGLANLATGDYEQTLDGLVSSVGSASD